MATTNIDAVAEFKILTNAYQAEYGRAVGGQVQVVTKSGTQAFHGSGYWYGRRSDWNANTWTNKRDGAPPPVGRARSPSLRTPRATTMDTRSAAPSTFPARSTRTRRSSSSSGARSTSAARTRWPSGRAGCPPPSSGAGTSLRASTAAATRSRTSVTTRPACPAPPADTRGCFADGGVLGRIPAEPDLPAGPERARHLPRRRTSRGPAASTTAARSPTTGHAARTSCGWTSRPRTTGASPAATCNKKDDHEQAYGTTWAGAGSNNLDGLDTLFTTPGSNFMLSTTGILSPTTSVELSVGRAHNSLDFIVRNDELRRSAAGLSGLPLLFPDAVQDDYIPDFRLQRRPRARRQRRAATRPTAVPSRTRTRPGTRSRT